MTGVLNGLGPRLFRPVLGNAPAAVLLAILKTLLTRQVHDWLDELQADYGPMHRPFRHHTDGVAWVRAMWGDEAAKAAEIHIRRDCGGTLPTPQERRDYWGIRLEEIEPEDD